jgi:acetolactate synthase I/II/III large subunit
MPARRMTGAEALARMLAEYRVTHFFMVPAVLRRTMAAMGELTDIQRLHVHGEKAAAYMADGYARASRRPGVCGAQVIGAMNLAAGLRDAQLAHSPVIALTGGRDPATKYRGVYQEVDDVPAFEQVTKFNATVDSVERFPDMIRQAFRAAVTGCPGPVHLQFRGNEAQLDADEADLDIFTESRFSHIPPFRVEPSDADIQRALEILHRAERPVMVAGGGVRASNAGRALVALAERMAIPIATSLNGKDSIPGTNALSVGVVGTYSRESANRLLGEADVVCFIGTQTGSMTTHFWRVPPVGVCAIQIDIDGEGLGRNYPLDAAILSDARVALEHLLARCDAATAGRRQAWLERVASLRSGWYGKYQPQLTSESVPIRPERICAELSELVPADGVVVVDTGHAGMWMGGMYDVSDSAQSYIRSAGHLGWAFPAGLGAKCAVPDRPVITFTGDAGIWYHIGELETAVRWGINAITIVNNNSSGNQSRPGFDRVYGGQQGQKGRELWTFTDVSFAAIAESVGALGLRVDKPQQFAPAFLRALEANRPVVIDVATDIDALAPSAVF